MSGARAGALAMVPLALGYLPFAFVIGTAAGHSSDPLAAWAGSLLVFAGSAHLVVVETVTAGGATGGIAWSAIGAAILINARLLVLSAALAPIWRSARLPARLAAGAVVIDPLWMLVGARTSGLPGGKAGAQAPATQRRYYAGAAAMLALLWSATMAVGTLLSIHGSSAVGEASMVQIGVPVCLAAVVGPQLRSRRGAAAVLSAGVVAVLTKDLPAGSGLLLAMAAAALGGCALGRRSLGNRSLGSRRAGAPAAAAARVEVAS